MPSPQVQTDGFQYRADPSSGATDSGPAYAPGNTLAIAGQTVNKVAGNVTNMGIGTVAVGVLGAGVTGTVVISDTLIGVQSFLFFSVQKRDTSTDSGTPPGATAFVRVDSYNAPTAGSCTVNVTNTGAGATLATDYVLHYWVVNQA